MECKQQQIDDGVGIYDKEEDFLVLSNLTLLSKLQPYQKLIIHIKYPNLDNNEINFDIKIDNSYLPQIARWLYKQNRTDTIEHLNRLIDISLQLYHKYKLKHNRIGMNKYATLLESSKFGLSNLKLTYNNDQSITSNLDVIIEKIDVFRLNSHSVV